MNRIVVASTAAAVILLSAGAYFWFHSPGPTITPIESGVRVVAGTSLRDRAADRQRIGGSKGAAAGSRETSPVEAKAVAIPDDPALQATLLDPAWDPRTLYKRIRTEHRDADWAARSERSINAAIAPIPYVDRERLRVSCASTLCEIHGAMTRNLSIDNANVAMGALQGETLSDTLARAGLQTKTQAFGGEGADSVFTIYATRKQADPAPK